MILSIHSIPQSILQKIFNFCLKLIMNLITKILLTKMSYLSIKKRLLKLDLKILFLIRFS